MPVFLRLKKETAYMRLKGGLLLPLLSAHGYSEFGIHGPLCLLPDSQHVRGSKVADSAVVQYILSRVDHFLAMENQRFIVIAGDL
jgi:hypothetical protein